MNTHRSKHPSVRKHVTDAAPTADPPVAHRPDGWYWMSDDGRREVGPFATADDALADFRAVTPSEIAPGESLQEAEAELGIAEWTDPDTGEPAEEHTPRTEEH